MTKQELENDAFVRHRKNKKYYRVASAKCRMKNPDTGDWVDAVAYAPLYENEHELFMREVDSFLEDFELVNMPVVETMGININTRAEVVLTEAGAEHLNRHNDYEFRYYDCPVPHYEGGDPYKTELWHLMQIFGVNVATVNRPFFEGNMINLELPAGVSLYSNR